MTEEQIRLLKRLVADVVAGDFEALRTDGRLGRLTEAEISQALADYPGRITMPPDDAFSRFHYYPIERNDSVGAIIEFDLWYNNKPSDLTLTAVFNKANAGWTIQLSDMHVL